MKCIFCLNFLLPKTAIHLNDKLDESGDNTARDLIELHFPFAEKILQSSSGNGICYDCWINVQSFHEFFLLVSNNYGVDKASEGFLYNIDETPSEDIIVYELVDSLKELLPSEEIVKQENNTSLEEPITEWVAAQDKPEEPIELQILDQSELADDERIRETAQMFCELCPAVLESLRDAKSHYKNFHCREGYIKCCHRKFKQRCRLVEHVNTHYNFTYQCPVCNKTFDSKSYLSKHMACHETVKEYQCDHCSKSFAKKFQIRNHLVSVHMFDHVEAQFECPIDNCFKKYVNQARLKHHLTYTHTESKKEQICEICSKTFKSKSSLEEHRKLHFKKPEYRIKCEICGHYQSNEKSFARHMKNHATESLENCCSYCGKKSPNLNALKKHIKFVHETEKTYFCKYCVKGFKRQRTLIDHEASVHTMQDLYTCTFCPRTFRSQSNMLVHRKNKHPQQYQKPSYMREDISQE